MHKKIAFGIGSVSIIVGQPLKEGEFVTLCAPLVINYACEKY